jgi:protein-L-isoaspartate(D-aspartate) O-methyltransferase
MPAIPREETLSHLVLAGYLKSKNVIAALKAVSREDFLPEELRQHAWEDHPLPIGFGQTISAPHMYAFMLEAAQIHEGDKVLEVGAGSGYGAALLSYLVGRKGKVYTLEVVPQLVGFARTNLKKAGSKATVVEADGWHGYAKEAPYDKILVTAACPAVPAPLLAQLKEGGRMLAPVGGYFQDLVLIEKTKAGIKETPILPVLFVPLIKKE